MLSATNQLLHRFCGLPMVCGLWLMWGAACQAIVLYDTDNPLTNTTAPTGIYEDSGWAYQGRYGAFLGTMIGEQYFITAKHMGLQGGTFVSTAAFNGVSDVVYTIDASANGGTGYWDIAGTDLRILKINESFSSWAPLYTGSLELTSTLVTFGRGAPRGAEVLIDDAGPPVADVLHGWYTQSSDGVARWGANVVSDVISSGVGSLLVAEFNAVSGQNEATLSSGDSGGGVFIKVGAQWYLAGVNYAADGLFDTNSTKGDFSEFEAALFDMGGFFIGDDGTSWQQVPNGLEDIPSHMYASRISSSATQIMAIVAVPEPAGGMLILLAGLTMLRRRR